MEENDRQRRKDGCPPVKFARWLKEFERVINTPDAVGSAIIHTDKDLIELTNMNLDEDERISVSTFEKWKSGSNGDSEDGWGVYLAFLRVYKKALLQQRKNLFDSMSRGVPGEWQKWAWILERKFDEWNLRSKTVDETPDVKRLVFRVTGQPE